MDSRSAQGIQRAFVTGVGIILGFALLGGIWSAIAGSGPAARIKELMPVIDARGLDVPLTSNLADYALEAAPKAESPAVVRLSDYPKDTVLFLNFWASWCEPCVRELPSMLRLKRELKSRRFRMLAVSYDDDWATLRQFFRQFPDGVPHELELARDGETAPAKMLRSAFGTEKLPETYVIKDGRILARFINERDWMSPAIVEYFQRLLEL